jgi:signal transduction histidine kinase
MVVIEVADSGCGIAPEHLPHLFDRFYRVDRTRSGAGGNVGLGLAIVKTVATLHGGAVSIDSAIGRGTRASRSEFRLQLLMPDQKEAVAGGGFEPAIYGPVDFLTKC